MRATCCQSIPAVALDAIAQKLHREPGFIYLRSSHQAPHPDQNRYSLLACRPFLTFQARASQVLLSTEHRRIQQFGNPWSLLADLIARYELKDDVDWPFPLGGCFGFWGYDLKNFLEPQLPRNAHRDLEIPDCFLGFYDSLLVTDHRLNKSWIVSTGLRADGSRQARRASQQLDFWRRIIDHSTLPAEAADTEWRGQLESDHSFHRPWLAHPPSVQSTLSREQFIAGVQRCLKYIRTGHIYQVNLSQRLAAPLAISSWQFFKELTALSPAPFSAFLHAGHFQIASASPELFLRLSGNAIVTRPIKGTRPRSADPVRDAQLGVELQSSAKDLAELLMITDLLRNDLGKVCEFGSIQVPDLVRLEPFPQVQHLVSTIQGHLRPYLGHADALAATFPGGSITGAPKIRAMEIIDELEPTTRGPYTGCLGYLGFNRESQLNILIRTAIFKHRMAYFPVGAGIVADSDPHLEYEETLAKAAAFLALASNRNPLPARHPTAPTPSLQP